MTIMNELVGDACCIHRRLTAPGGKRRPVTPPLGAAVACPWQHIAATAGRWRPGRGSAPPAAPRCRRRGRRRRPGPRRSGSAACLDRVPPAGPAGIVPAGDRGVGGDGEQRMNAIIERWIGGCRRELLDRTLVWNQAHLRRVLHAYEIHHDQHRPHRSMDAAAPLKPLPEPVDLDRYPVRRQTRSPLPDQRIPPGHLMWTRFSARTRLGCWRWRSSAAQLIIRAGISSGSAPASRHHPPGGDASALPFAPSSGPAWSARVGASCPSPSWSPPWNARAGPWPRTAAS